MPIYGYECKECGVRFERRQSFSDEPIDICPECEGEVRRLLQPAGIIFKGSGFYVTDNRGSKGNLTSTSKKDGDNNGSSTTSSSKSDATTSSDSISKSESTTSPKSESKKSSD